MKTEYSFYTIIADAYIYMGSQQTRVHTGTWGQLLQNITVNTTQFPVIVDSGTTMMYLPTGNTFFKTALTPGYALTFDKKRYIRILSHCMTHRRSFPRSSPPQ